MAKHLTLENVLGQGAAIDGNERAAALSFVDGTGHHFLAGAGFTAHQQIDLGGRQRGDASPCLDHAWGLAHQAKILLRRYQCVQAPVLQHQLALSRARRMTSTRRSEENGFSRKS